MRLCSSLIFSDRTFAAGERAELAPPEEVQALLGRCGAITRLGVEAGDLVVVRLGGAPRIVPAWAVELVAATSSEAA